jgi:hypothetical protein
MGVSTHSDILFLAIEVQNGIVRDFMNELAKGKDEPGAYVTRWHREVRLHHIGGKG